MLKANVIPDLQILASLPIFPLPNVVLLPGMVLPLNIFEPRYLELVDFVRAHGQHIGVPLLCPASAAPNGPPTFEQIFGVGKLIFHVKLPDGRRIIRLEGICRVRMQQEHTSARRFREVAVAALHETQPPDGEQFAVLRAQVERIAQFCGEDGESLLSSLLTMTDARSFLYTLTAFLPSLELLVASEGDLVADRRALVALQQQSLDAESPDLRVRFLIARTSGILLRLGQQFTTPPSLLN